MQCSGGRLRRMPPPDREPEPDRDRWKPADTALLAAGLALVLLGAVLLVAGGHALGGC